MKGALASLWGKANSAERFTSIVLITLWVVGTAWFFAEIFKVCAACLSAYPAADFVWRWVACSPRAFSS